MVEERKVYTSRTIMGPMERQVILMEPTPTRTAGKEEEPRHCLPWARRAIWDTKNEEKKKKEGRRTEGG